MPKSSRATLTTTNNNESSNLTVYPKRAESITKSSMILQPRYTQTIIEPYTHFLLKDQSQPQLQSQMQAIKRESFMPNNSMQMPTHGQHPQNYGSRIELRPNSSEKMIKENLPMRASTQLPQGFMESSFGVNSCDPSRKIKKSGLTIFKAAENEQKAQ
jgi:hypothetical protein